jgi:CheY-like chemotaxis protein
MAAPALPRFPHSILAGASPSRVWLIDLEDPVMTGAHVGRDAREDFPGHVEIPILTELSLPQRCVPHISVSNIN